MSLLKGMVDLNFTWQLDFRTKWIRHDSDKHPITLKDAENFELTRRISLISYLIGREKINMS